MFNVAVLGVSLLLTSVLVGCGGGDEVPSEFQEVMSKIVPATGKVTLAGEPLANATVTFIPVNDGADTASAVTDANGMYDLVTPLPGISPEESKGVAPGEYRVRISRFAMPDGSPIPAGMMEAEAEGEGAKESVPAKYSNFEATTLKVTVASPKAENNFDLEK